MIEAVDIYLLLAIDDILESLSLPELVNLPQWCYNAHSVPMWVDFFLAIDFMRYILIASNH